MKAIIVRGPLGVGKTTVGRGLARCLGGCYVSIDGILDENHLDETDGECVPLGNFLKANKLAVAQVKDALDAGASIVFDGNFYHLEQLEDLISRLPDGADVFTLKASLDTCIARDRARQRPYGVDAAAAVHILVSRFDYGTCIDSEGRTAEQVVSQIRRACAGDDREAP